jgi:hypothetical protein
MNSSVVLLDAHHANCTNHSQFWHTERCSANHTPYRLLMSSGQGLPENSVFADWADCANFRAG